MKSQKMTGGNSKGPLSSSHNKSSSSSSHKKSRWESGNNSQSDHKSVASANDSKPEKPSPNPKNDSPPGPSKPKPPTDQIIPPPSPGLFHPHGPGAPFHLPDHTGSSFTDPANFGPPPPPAYGFHMLERRTIALADGSVRSYFALPPDYQDFPPPGLPIDHPGRFFPFGPGGREPEPGSLGFDRHFLPDGFHRDRVDPYGRGGQSDYWNSLGLDGRGPMPPDASLKRKYGDEHERDPRDEFYRQRQQLLHHGNPNSNPNGFPLGPGDRGDFMAGTSSPFARDQMLSGRGTDDFRSSKHIRIGGDYDYGSSHSRHGEFGNATSSKLPDVDPQALKKSFLHYVHLINDNPTQKKNYSEDGKHGSLQCLTCGRASKEFPDVHGLIMHTYNSTDLRVDHLGLHKALCVLLGWHYAKAPENSRSYQSLSADEAARNKEDLIMWPPMVIIHNTNSGGGKDGHMEGMGNRTMDNKLKDLGFIGGKSKSLYGKDGPLGITLVKFAGDQSGLKEAIRLAEYFEKDNHGRRGWAHVQSTLSSRDDENNPNLVKRDAKTGEKTRILYGHLGTASDLDQVDFETRKKISIESRRELKISN